MAKDIDWTAIKAAYITSGKNYKQIAEEFGECFGSVANRGKRDEWPRLRREFREKAAQQAIEREVSNEADRLGLILKAANAMSRVIDGIFADADQFHRHIVQDKFIHEDGGMDIITTEKIFDKVDSRAIKDLTGALKDMTLVLRNLNNLPTQAEAEAQRIAAERLKLEQMKANGENSVDKRIEVILSADMEEFSK